MSGVLYKWNHTGCHLFETDFFTQCSALGPVQIVLCIGSSLCCQVHTVDVWLVLRAKISFKRIISKLVVFLRTHTTFMQVLNRTAALAELQWAVSRTTAPPALSEMSKRKVRQSRGRPFASWWSLGLRNHFSNTSTRCLEFGIREHFFNFYKPTIKILTWNLIRVFMFVLVVEVVHLKTFLANFVSFNMPLKWKRV